MVSMKYVIITPARNEDAFIENTIKSVIVQTIKPIRWIIVSDGSTDNTDGIVKKYEDRYKWIQLIRMNDHQDRQFAAKVHCFNAGYKKINCLNYDLIGNLDADVTFDCQFFEYLIKRFKEIPDLGVAGTTFFENGKLTYGYNHADFNHVSGACQIFRKKCFENIGGYIPIKGGGIDWVAVTTARMKGWKTKTFNEKSFIHHRVMGTANRGLLNTRFQYGQKDYYLGGHPLWEIFRGMYQMTKKPFVLGGLNLIAGYFYSSLLRIERPVSPELICFHRKEQMQRLKKIILGKIMSVSEK